MKGRGGREWYDGGVGTRIVREKIPKEALSAAARENFETMVKVAVDVARGLLTVGGEWHSEGQELLVRDGSSGAEVWGVNFYPWHEPKNRIEYIALINIKPSVPNRAMEIHDTHVKQEIHDIVQTLLLSDDKAM